MGHAPEYISNILAKIQYLQDLYSRHFNLCITLYNQVGNCLMIPSGYSLYCYENCGDRTPCNRHTEKLLQRARKETEPIYTYCPKGLRMAIFPLGLSLETNISSRADHFLVLRNSNPTIRRDILSPDALSLEPDDSASADTFIETAQLIAYNLDMIFSLVRMQGISLEDKKVWRKRSTPS